MECACEDSMTLSGWPRGEAEQPSAVGQEWVPPAAEALGPELSGEAAVQGCHAFPFRLAPEADELMT